MTVIDIFPWAGLQLEYHFWFGTTELSCSRYRLCSLFFLLYLKVLRRIYGDNMAFLAGEVAVG